MTDQHDEPGAVEPRAPFTPERVAVLVEFADNVMAGRRLMRWIAYLGAVATAIVVLAYYVLGIWNGIHTPMPQPKH